MASSLPLDQIQEISKNAGFTETAVAFFDYETALNFAYNGDRLFHAASTFKAAVLVALYRAVEEKQVRLDDYLHVRNRFLSVADGSVFKLDAKRDGASKVYKHVGRCLRIQQLAKAMIVRSSNLATNLLIDFLGLDYVKEKMREAHLEDAIQIVRGVEDERAFERDINNLVTASGLVRLFRLLIDGGGYLSESSKKEILDILFAQEFTSMLPADLPSEVDVAHKTGEISTVCHDAGLIFAPNHKPYAIAILTEAPGKVDGRKRAVAEISKLIFDYLRPEGAQPDTGEEVP